MTFKTIQACALAIILIVSCNALHAETLFALTDSNGTTLDLFGIHSYPEFFNQDYSKMITTCYNKFIIWDTQTGKDLLVFDERDDFQVKEGIFSPNGELVLLVTTTETSCLAVMCNARTGEQICTLVGFNDSTATFSPDSTKIMGVGTNDNNVVVWNAQTGMPLFTLDSYHLCVFSPNGKTIINASRFDLDTKIYDAQTGELIHTLFNVNFYGFNQNGNRILVFNNVNEETKLEAFIISLESNQLKFENPMKIKIATSFDQYIPINEYLLIPTMAINPAKFIYGINLDEGYAILKDKHTGQEKILSLLPDSVPNKWKRAFHICSIEK